MIVPHLCDPKPELVAGRQFGIRFVRDNWFDSPDCEHFPEDVEIEQVGSHSLSEVASLDPLKTQARYPILLNDI